MSVSKYRWTEACEGQPCPGDCDLCSKEPEAKNDDLISRQAAIDFIDAGRLGNPNEARWSDNEVVNFLKSRPSAQPEIVRCKDCKHWTRIYTKWHCDIHFNVGHAEFYCADGERRTDD